MDSKESLFAAFGSTTKEEWLEKIHSELKGQPLENLDWLISPELAVSPFAHREDWPAESAPLSGVKLSNDWEIGEDIQIDSIQDAHQQALEALKNGVQAPRWVLQRPLQVQDWQQLLENIELAFISTHIGGIQKVEEFPAIWTAFLELVDKHPQRLSLRGSVFIEELDQEETPVGEMVALLENSAQILPGFRLLTVNGHLDYGGPEGVIKELTGILVRGAQLMESYTELGLSPETVHRHIQLSISVGTSYFLEIAKIRALKVLWVHVMEAFGISHLDLPPVDVHFAPESQLHDPHQNMIRATTQAMSAVIGGVDRLTVLPSDAFEGEVSSSFSRRIARNVQHLLKMESYLDRVIDPAAGSFYLEKLTDELARQAWGSFQERKN